MIQPLKSGQALIDEIDSTRSETPVLWWLGQSGFVVRFATITFYVDPCFSTHQDQHRLIAPPLTGAEVRNADMILATHAHPGHLDAPNLIPMLEASANAKVLLPKATAQQAHAEGIPYERMTTTDADLRVEYFKSPLYARVYAVPSAHPRHDWTASTGYPGLGYLLRFGRWTVYHAGGCVPYEGLADRLRPYNVSIALLPVGDGNFSASDAAELAFNIGATWVVPMHYGTFGLETGVESQFITHMLGHHPEQRFKIFKCGEKWTVPEE